MCTKQTKIYFLVSKYLLDYFIYYEYSMVDTVADQPTAALRVAGSIPARNKHMYGLHLAVPGLVVCVNMWDKMIINAATTQEILSVEQSCKNP